MSAESSVKANLPAALQPPAGLQAFEMAQLLQTVGYLRYLVSAQDPQLQGKVNWLLSVINRLTLEQVQVAINGGLIEAVANVDNISREDAMVGGSIHRTIGAIIGRMDKMESKEHSDRLIEFWIKSPRFRMGTYLTYTYCKDFAQFYGMTKELVRNGKAVVELCKQLNTEQSEFGEYMLILVSLTNIINRAGPAGWPAITDALMEHNFVNRTKEIFGKTYVSTPAGDRDPLLVGVLDIFICMAKGRGKAHAALLIETVDFILCTMVASSWPVPSGLRATLERFLVTLVKLEDAEISQCAADSSIVNVLTFLGGPAFTEGKAMIAKLPAGDPSKQAIKLEPK